MVRRRGRTAWIAAGWLCCQLFAFALPIAASVIPDSAEICTCPGGVPGAQCPMHHHTLGTAPRPDGPAVRNTCVQADAMLLSLAGGPGVLPEPAGISFDRVESPVAIPASAPLQRTELPDSPPPRA